MAQSGEIDLRHDDALAELISSFLDHDGPRQLDTERGPWTPFSLAGFEDMQLHGRFHHDIEARLLVWEVEVYPMRGDTKRRILLHYAMTAEELGDIWSDRDRCELRLGKFAEAHLRAHLHLVQHGYVPVANGGLTLIDRKGWAESS